MLARSFALCSAGAIAGIILVLACGDDSPEEADAAVGCDCSEAEPPLAGRVVLEEHPRNSAGVGVGAACNQVEGGAYPQVLSGGCRIVDEATRESGQMNLVESYKKVLFDDVEGWTCTYDNDTGETVEIMITLTCLQPSPAGS